MVSIGGIGGNTGYGYGMTGTQGAMGGSQGYGQGVAQGYAMSGTQGYGVAGNQGHQNRNEDENATMVNGRKLTDGKGWGPDHQIKPGRKSSPAECKTCKTRKYQDGSDEMVSFKAPGHIAPENAAAVVLSHEHEHVANAYNKAKNGNGHVERATVQLKVGICPECGRSYISGGVTNTQIKYYNEDNPYQKGLKRTDAIKLRGAHLDIAA